MSSLAAQRKYQQVDALIRETLASASNSQEAWVEVQSLQIEWADILVDQARIDEAASVAQRVLPANNDPQVVYMRRILGRLDLAAGRFADAEPRLLDAWSVASKLDEIKPEARRRLARQIVNLYEHWDQHEKEAATWRSVAENVQPINTVRHDQR